MVIIGINHSQRKDYNNEKEISQVRKVIIHPVQKWEDRHLGTPVNCGRMRTTRHANSMTSCGGRTV